MLRAIMRQKAKDGANGAVTESFHTLDFECGPLEDWLSGGGYNETSYEIIELVGIEIRLPSASNS